MAKIKQQCGTCTHLKVRLNKAGRRTVRRDDYYSCEYSWGDFSPILPVLPACMKITIEKTYMTTLDGGGCVFWKIGRAHV